MYQTSLDKLVEEESKLKIAKEVAIRKAFESGNVNDIYKAQKFLEEQKRVELDKKAFLVDPIDLSASLGYKEKRGSLTYDVLRGMAKTHVIKAIIETRKDQVAAFCTPQENKNSTGFIIQKRRKFSLSKEKKELTKKEQQRIEDLTNFILDCGNSGEKWDADTFDVFISKIVDDSLTLDQATFECIDNMKGELSSYIATDAATFRVADTYDNENYNRKGKEIRGYLPSYVQIYQNNITAEFYPWELCFGVRNPKTDIRKNGYGVSELEDLIQTVTALLNADLYNANFFKVGSSPKGILRYSGNINTNTVDDFRKQWQAQVAGVMNAHKIPIINADKMDFISTQTSNRDMEYSTYQEFLIKISCATYKIDPSEIGFPMSGSSTSSPLFEGSNESRLKYSKDKGLKPLLKRVEFWINKYIIQRLDKEYEFRFVGLEDDELDKELDNDIKELSNFAMLDEIRVKRNLEPLGKERGGELIFNPIYNSFIMQMQMQNQQGQGQEGDGEQGNNFGGGVYDDTAEDDNLFNQGQAPEEEDNPFTKALKQDLPKLLQI